MLSVARHEMGHVALHLGMKGQQTKYRRKLVTAHALYGKSPRHTLSIEKKAWAGAIKAGRGRVHWGVVRQSIASYGGNLRDMAALVRFAHRQRTQAQREASRRNLVKARAARRRRAA